MIKPEVSVVMSVYNGAQFLRESIESILSQEGVDFEFIIVNDGSTDITGQIISEYAESDKRVKLIEQDNTGLTKALIRGCEVAGGKYIARQDAGDISLPGRLFMQSRLLDERDGCSFVSAHSECVGPQNEHLYSSEFDELYLNARLQSLNVNELIGPSSHPVVMMRRQSYIHVGGYRSQFYFAQDLDLWTRLIEIGKHGVVPQILYRYSITPEAISGFYAREQRKLRELIIKAASLRRQGKNDSEILNKAEMIKPRTRGRIATIRKAQGNYFLGCCLQENNLKASKNYFKRTVRQNPFHLKAWIKLLVT